MAVITSSNVANAITKLVAADVLPALMGNLVMGNLVSRDYEPTVAQIGDHIAVPIPSLGEAEIELSTHAEASFLVPDITKVLAVPDLLALYMQPAVVALAEKIETDLLALYDQFTVNTSLGAASEPITEVQIDAAGATLFQAKVAASQPKYLVVDANAYSVLRRVPCWCEYDTAGEAGLRSLVDGSIGQIRDFFVFRSQYVAKTGSNPAATHNLAFSKDAICVAIRRLPKPLPGSGTISEYSELGNFGMRVTMEYRPNTLAQQFTIAVLYGCRVLRPDHGVEITT